MNNSSMSKIIESQADKLVLTTTQHHKLSGHTVLTDLTGDVTQYAHMGGLNRFQEEAVRYYTKSRAVYDLGAGLLGWSKKLADFGAAVIALDEIYKDPRENVLNRYRNWVNCVPKNVLLRPHTFREYCESGPMIMDVAFISWPHNTYGKTMGLELLAQRSKTVIYLGKNLDGTACGSPQFWKLMTQRKVLCFLPAVRNSLIVYGPMLQMPRRDLLHEEKGAIEGPWDNILYSPPEWPCT